MAVRRSNLPTSDPSQDTSHPGSSPNPVANISSSMKGASPSGLVKVDELNCVELWGGNHLVDTGVKVPGLRGWLSSRPYAASARGGDVFYLSSCADGALTRASVADVSGHGADVARLALRLRDMMRSHIETFDHGSVLRALNSEFGEGQEDGRFATAILVSFYRDTGDFLYSLAGHEGGYLALPLCRRFL